MARQAHPGEHDPRIREHLENSLTSEVLIPCPDLATAKLIRSRFYSLIRAHRQHRTKQRDSFRHFSSRIIATSRVQIIRPHYSADCLDFPLTLILDGRSLTDDILDHAVTSEPRVQMTSRPEDGLSSDPDDLLPPEDEEDVYDAIASRYRLKPETP